MKPVLFLALCLFSLSQMACAQTANDLFGSDRSVTHLYGEGRRFAKKNDGLIYYGMTCPDVAPYFGIMDTLQPVSPGYYKSAFREIRDSGGVLHVYEPFWHREKRQRFVLGPATEKAASYFLHACETDHYSGPSARARGGTVARTTGCYKNMKK